MQRRLWLLWVSGTAIGTGYRRGIGRGRKQRCGGRERLAQSPLLAALADIRGAQFWCSGAPRAVPRAACVFPGCYPMAGQDDVGSSHWRCNRRIRRLGSRDDDVVPRRGVSGCLVRSLYVLDIHARVACCRRRGWCSDRGCHGGDAAPGQQRVVTRLDVPPGKGVGRYRGGLLGTGATAAQGRTPRHRSDCNLNRARRCSGFGRRCGGRRSLCGAFCQDGEGRVGVAYWKTPSFAIRSEQSCV